MRNTNATISLLFIPALVFNLALPPQADFEIVQNLQEVALTTSSLIPEPETKPKLPPIFEKIAFCESGGRQFYKSGEVVMSKTRDVGKFQVNQVHWEKAKEMGIDLWTKEGNEKFALYLYEKSGLIPWSASKKCWSTPKIL